MCGIGLALRDARSGLPVTPPVVPVVPAVPPIIPVVPRQAEVQIAPGPPPTPAATVTPAVSPIVPGQAALADGIRCLRLGARDRRDRLPDPGQPLRDSFALRAGSLRVGRLLGSNGGKQ